MDLLKNQSKVKHLYGRIGKNRLYPKPKSDVRLFLEAFIMLFVGTNLILFLNSIPNSFIWNEFAYQAWNNLTEGLLLLSESLIKIGSATSVVFLMLFSIFLITGGSIRFIRLLLRIKYLRIRIIDKNKFLK